MRGRALSAYSKASTVSARPLPNQSSKNIGTSLGESMTVADRGSGYMRYYHGEEKDTKRICTVVYTPTVCLGATSVVADTYGHGNGRIGPTRCAFIGAARGDR
jgi:hypothetical protein